MSTKYRIESVGNAFIVIDDLDYPVGRYPTEEAARQDSNVARKKMRCGKREQRIGRRLK